MKKLVVVGALALGCVSLMANNVPQYHTTSLEVVVQDDFTQIATSDLPDAVTEAVATSYPTATIDKAYVNADKQFKLEVVLGDGTTGTLYADEEGNWIDM
ncbi:hypothetical protein [Maribacter sp. 2307ULW6-5]|uniref:hypothetical protein n=1 Tax=Maribacter sp. 2307ULW6-5 TaxID=3386275 RepID=UPI0039BD9025